MRNRPRNFRRQIGILPHTRRTDPDPNTLSRMESPEAFDHTVYAWGCLSCRQQPPTTDWHEPSRIREDADVLDRNTTLLSPVRDQGGQRTKYLIKHARTQYHLTSPLRTLAATDHRGPRMRGPPSCHVAELPELVIELVIAPVREGPGNQVPELNVPGGRLHLLS